MIYFLNFVSSYRIHDGKICNLLSSNPETQLSPLDAIWLCYVSDLSILLIKALLSEYHHSGSVCTIWLGIFVFTIAWLSSISFI